MKVLSLTRAFYKYVEMVAMGGSLRHWVMEEYSLARSNQPPNVTNIMGLLKDRFTFP